MRRPALYPHTLQGEISVAFAVLIVISVIVLTQIFYSFSKTEIERDITINAQISLDKCSQRLETELAQVESQMNALLMDQTLYNLFAQGNADNTLSLYRRDRTVISELTNTLGQMESVYDCSLITDNYVYGNVMVYQPTSVAARTRLVKMARDAGGQTVWVPTFNYFSMFMQPEESNFDYSQLWAAVKEMNFVHVDNNNTYGKMLPSNVEAPVLAVYFKEEWLKQVYSEAITRDGMQFALCDQQNNILSASDASLFSDGLPFAFSTGEKAEGEYSTSTRKYGSMLIIYNTIPTTQWYGIIYCPMRVMLKDAFQLERIAYIFCGLICLVALLVAHTISQNITRPLKELNRAIACSGSGQFNTLLPANGPDDVQKLISTYNSMNEHIQALIQDNYEKTLREKDLQIMSLHLQMEPHFLFNTLNTINWMAINAGEMKISRVILQLSHMLQYTLHTKKELTPFEEDILWTRAYVELIELRFGERMTCVFDMDPALAGTLVPMLFLQPFIENAVVHGLDSVASGGRIEISGRVTQQGRMFTVTDNGKGMTEDEIRATMGKDISRIGIHNVDVRVKLIWGDAYGVSIASVPGKSTTVTILLP